MADPQGKPVQPSQPPIAPAADSQRPTMPATPPPSSSPPSKSMADYFEKELERLTESFASQSEVLDKIRNELVDADEVLEISNKQLQEHNDKQSKEYQDALKKHQSYLKNVSEIRKREMDVGRSLVEVRQSYKKKIDLLEETANRQYDQAKKLNTSLGEVGGAMRVMAKTTIDEAAKNKAAFRGLTEGLKQSNEIIKKAEAKSAEDAARPIDEFATKINSLTTSLSLAENNVKLTARAFEAAELAAQKGGEAEKRAAKEAEDIAKEAAKERDDIVKKINDLKKAEESRLAIEAEKKTVLADKGIDTGELAVFKGVNNAIEKLIDVSALSAEDARNQFAEMMKDEKEREKATIAVSESIRTELEANQKTLQELETKAKSKDGFGGIAARMEAKREADMLRASMENSRKILEKIQLGGVKGTAAMQSLVEGQLKMSDEQRKKNIKDMEAAAELKKKGIPPELVPLIDGVNSLRGLVKDMIPKVEGKSGILKVIFLFLAFTVGAWMATVWARLTAWFTVTKGILSLVMSVGSSIINGITKLIPSFIKSGFMNVVSGITNAVSKIGGVFSGFFAPVGNLVSKISTGVGAVGTKIGGVAGTIMNFLKPLVGGIKFLGTYASGFFGVLTKAFRMGFNLIAKLPFIGWIISGVMAIIDIFKTFKALAGSTDGFFTKLLKGIVVALIQFLTLGFLDFKKVLNFVNNSFAKIGEWWNMFMEGIGKIADWVWSWIKTISTEVYLYFKRVYNEAMSVLNAIGSTLESISDWMWSWIKTISTEIDLFFTGIYDGAMRIVNSIKDFVESIADWAWGWIDTIRTEVKNFFTGIIDWVKGVIGGAVASFGEFLMLLLSPIMGPIQGFIKVVEMFIDWLKNSTLGKWLGFGGEEKKEEPPKRKRVEWSGIEADDDDMGVTTTKTKPASETTTKTEPVKPVSGRKKTDVPAVENPAGVLDYINNLIGSGEITKLDDGAIGELISRANGAGVAATFSGQIGLRSELYAKAKELAEMRNARSRVSKSSTASKNVVGEATAKRDEVKTEQEAAKTKADSQQGVVANTTTVVNNSTSKTQVTPSPSRYNPEPTLRGTQMAALPGVV